MITKAELEDLLQTTETYCVKRTPSTNIPQDDTQSDIQDDAQNNLVTHLSHRPRKSD